MNVPWPARKECDHVRRHQPQEVLPWAMQHHAYAGFPRWSVRSCIPTRPEGPGATRASVLRCNLGQCQFPPGGSSSWQVHEQPKIRQLSTSFCKGWIRHARYFPPPAAWLGIILPVMLMRISGLTQTRDGMLRQKNLFLYVQTVFFAVWFRCKMTWFLAWKFEVSEDDCAVMHLCFVKLINVFVKS